MDSAARPGIRVATITVGTNELGWLDECLSTLLASSTPGIDLSVWLVDNASTDTTADHVATAYPEVRVIRNQTNLGFAKANNIAVRAVLDAGADYVFLVNPDTRTPQHLITELVGFMETWPEYGAVGPLQRVYSDRTPPAEGDLNDWARLVMKWRESSAFVADRTDRPVLVSPLEGRAPDTIEFAYVEGSAIFLRASMLRAVGLFDEVLHTYYEETDLCRRARWARWRVAVLTNLAIEHFGGGSTGGSAYRRIHMRRGRYFYLLTDIDWTLIDITALAFRWLWADLRGHTVGGETTWWRGSWETLQTAAWLMQNLRWIRQRRQAHRRLAECARRTGASLTVDEIASLVPADLAVSR